MEYKYCSKLSKYERFKTINVKVGNSSIGGEQPIQIQSMTDTDTLDTQASVNQCIKIFNVGADFVRLTVQTIRHAENLKNIKESLRKKGYNQPIIADVHFNPKVAEIAAGIVEKVRINPGNFVDRNNPSEKSYTEGEFISELKKIDLKFSNLIKICKKYKTALRIGSNHGSLSNRIVDRYGDTPIGMVESVMEFLRVAQKEDFHQIVISLKSSNTRVMVYAYRLLMNKMLLSGMNYPIHLGVTEAGDGEDGRIKSTIGISSLLIDGIGDTIRVSLTEDPEKEIPVAQKIVGYINQKKKHQTFNYQVNTSNNPFIYKKRETYNQTGIGSENVPIVIADLSIKNELTEADLINLSYKYNKNDRQWTRGDLSPDFLFIGNSKYESFDTNGLKLISNYYSPEKNTDVYPIFCSLGNYLNSGEKSNNLNFIAVSNNIKTIELLKSLKKDKTIVLILKSENNNSYADKRAFINWLINENLKFPVISFNKYNDIITEDFQVKSAADNGPLLIDGLIDGIMLKIENKKTTSRQNLLLKNSMNISFGILQASRSRITKTEYISCPSCGRTLFDIQMVTKEIKEKTNHLKGVKIGIMGCIVNGPGEMADADFGYVGTGIGKVSLYKSMDIVKKNIPSENAVSELILLIKKNGAWIEKKT
ncbi:MAG: 4-hydroxy-3-methylbut-2-en-1-yl diphosphate synthase [Bacteroidetes bacterium 4572_117]|nr:MAG: 4-hydroxy-3-methylbut-2-en-1-yl diphosphate synthase [Bacteroidetes bacterium 4572_117]